MSDLTNMTRIEQILSNPDPEASLEALRDELNELAKLRETSRVAFCKRLALVYMLVVGRPLGKDEPKDGGSTKFYRWCSKNIWSASKKPYTTSTLRAYLRVGFSSDPAIALKTLRQGANRTSEISRKVGTALRHALSAEPKKVLPITKLRTKFSLPGNVAAEVNALMHAWESAGPEARSQFIYLVTGKRLEAA